MTLVTPGDDVAVVARVIGVVDASQSIDLEVEITDIEDNPVRIVITDAQLLRRNGEVLTRQPLPKIADTYRRCPECKQAKLSKAFHNGRCAWCNLVALRTPPNPLLGQTVCVDCGHASLSDPDHYQHCRCTTCDVPNE